MNKLILCALVLTSLSAFASDTGNYRDAQNDAYPVFHFKNHKQDTPTSVEPSVSRGSK
ncbi:hypothetical protein JCM19236_1532 [Vibrio sp. JCM 19236]|nr:hypothetical protein JCM19236_1532 [Vibrio sp. JCM 19236]